MWVAKEPGGEAASVPPGGAGAAPGRGFAFPEGEHGVPLGTRESELLPRGRGDPSRFGVREERLGKVGDSAGGCVCWKWK